MEPVGSELSHALTLSLDENGNSLNLIASSEAPLALNISQISKKLATWRFGSSLGNPWN